VRSGRRGDALMSRKRNSWIRAALLVALLGMLVAAPAAFAGTPQTPKTLGAKSIKATPAEGVSAELAAELSPAFAATEPGAAYAFEYAEGTECTGGAGYVRTEAKPNLLIAKGTVVEPVKELNGGAKYTVCAIATDSEGETVGNPESFKTPASKPAVQNGEAPISSPYGGAVRAAINPENESTSCAVEYGLKGGALTSVPCETASLTGAGAQTDGVTLTKLESGKTYEWAVVAKNGTGETRVTGEFTTPTALAPSVENESSTPLTATTVGLAATVRANFQKTTYKFEYSTDKALVETGKGTVAGAGEIADNELENIEQPISVKLEHLTPGTPYYFRAVAVNGTGTTDGAVQTFETYAVPGVVTGASSNETRTTAELSGAVNPFGEVTFYQFLFEPLEQYEEALEAGEANPFAYSRRTLETSAGSSYESQKIENVQITELKAGTVYVYVLAATNLTGTTVGAVQAFETAPRTPPVPTTGKEAANITHTSAEISGTVNTEGLPTHVWFELEQAGGTPSTVPATLTGVEGNFATYAATFKEDLAAGTTFYYWIVASNIDGESAGESKAFTTTALPNPFPAPTTYPLLPVSPTTTTTTKTTTVKPRSGPKGHKNAKKLKKALASCHKQHNKKKRQSCERTAKKKFG
jgi:hypothetical protein